MGERKVTDTKSRKTETTDIFGDKHTKDVTETTVNGQKTETGGGGKG